MIVLHDCHHPSFLVWHAFVACPPAQAVPGRGRCPCLRLPLLLHRIPAGFPSPGDEYAEAALDLNTYLIRNKVSTFFFRVMGIP
ncbi:LexA family protein [Nitrosospira multiformis]|uniref:Uncharacterized protein n=1 Tax=Nitrosospira multiformis TaxID=1231 RepID=A0A1I7IA09_9PROT|nr:hypothetical protein [Nitrosospira multiformis]SFU69823.1 hypothetical protein SAMN05216417_11654 [Nitrosospira multiformis]